jgi:hypothetical protein
LIVAGCDGGKKKDKQTQTRLSFDYFGLEVGHSWTFKVESYDPEDEPANGEHTITTRVLSQDQSGIFAAGTGGEGDYIDYYKLIGNTYYEVGLQEDGEDTWYEPDDYELLLKNPVELNDESDQLGKVMRQEKVTVPAGSFVAWVFYQKSTDDDITEEYTAWFVPYIGPVKTDSTETDSSGNIILSYNMELTSHSFDKSLSETLIPNNPNYDKIKSKLSHMLLHGKVKDRQLK